MYKRTAVSSGKSPFTNSSSIPCASCSKKQKEEAWGKWLGDGYGVRETKFAQISRMLKMLRSAEDMPILGSSLLLWRG